MAGDGTHFHHGETALEETTGCLMAQVVKAKVVNPSSLAGPGEIVADRV